MGTLFAETNPLGIFMQVVASIAFICTLVAAVIVLMQKADIE